MAEPSYHRGAIAPVPLKPRHDGWSPALQQAFIDCLGEGLGVSAAARAVGKSRQSVYQLRTHPGGAAFAAAWDAALRAARPAPTGPTSFDRAFKGVLRPVLYRGRVVGMRRVYSDAAACNILRSMLAARERRGEW